MKTEFNIEEFLSLDGYATDERVARRKTNDKLKISNTNEYFTPFSLVQYMSNKISEKNGMILILNFQNLHSEMGISQFI